MISYMLDTNIVIYTLNRRPAVVREQFVQHEGQLCISTVTLMELYFGAEKSSNPARNSREIEQFVARLELMDYDPAAAAHSGQLRAELQLSGKPIGPYDQMIAGHARSRGFILITNNTREFRRVPGLRVENWARPKA